jgi:putative nucleotidyltransferase with HDIG domain
VSTDDTRPADLPELRSFRAEVLSRRELPTLPVVLGRILSVVDGERSSTRDLVEVIEHDQALASRVLKLANSALFGCPRTVATIPRAVVLVGFSTVRNLALGAKVWDTLTVGGRQSELVEELWRHSALVAATAKVVAARIPGVDPDASFTAGLLHDVGKLILSLKLGMKYWSLVGAADNDHAVEDIERERLGVDHAEVGAWLLEAWRLPSPIVGAVGEHHRVPQGPEWHTTRMIFTADRLVRGTDFAAGELRPLAAEVLEQTAERGITTDTWTQLLGQLRDEANALSGLFGRS